MFKSFEEKTGNSSMAQPAAVGRNSTPHIKYRGFFIQHVDLPYRFKSCQ